MRGDVSRIRRKKGSPGAAAKSVPKVSEEGEKVRPSSEEGASEGFGGVNILSPHYFSRSGLLGDIMEKLPLGIMGRDITGGGRYVFWNAFMEELTGISRKGILHSSGESVLPRELQSLFQEQDARVVREERSLDCGMVPFPGAPGVRIHMVKILFREGHTGHQLVVSILQDLSRQAILEGRLRHAERSLGMFRERAERLRRILRVAAEQGGEGALGEQLSQVLGLVATMEESPGAPEESARHLSEKPGEDFLKNSPPEVFLLERDPMVRAFALRTLQWEHWPVHTAENREELLKLMEEKKPERGLFLLGYEDLDLPRGLPGRVVVLRGEEAPGEVLEECRKRGYQLCPKPFAAWELLESLRRCASMGLGTRTEGTAG
jgi:hypothetical protein